MNICRRQTDSDKLYLVLLIENLGNFVAIQKQPPEVFYIKSVLKNFRIFSGKHLHWSLFLINFIKKRLQRNCFPVNIAKSLRTPNFEEHLRTAASEMFQLHLIFIFHYQRNEQFLNFI